jgi:glycosyltransferase involved in cell wall biosynthesis
VTDYYPPDKIGGVGEIARRLRDEYRALGHDVLVVTTGERRPSEWQEGILRGRLGLVGGVFLNNLRILGLIRRREIDLVHLHQASTTLFLLARAFMKPFPFVLNSLQVSYLSEAREIRAHTVLGRRFRPSGKEWIERLVFAPVHVLLDCLGWMLSDTVTVVSADNRAEMVRTYGRLRERHPEVVPNGVPSEPARPTFRDEELETRLLGRTVVGYVGVFRARKRVANLLLAVRDVLPDCPDMTLLLVGGGRGYEEPLRRLARDLGLEDRVIFTGGVPQERVAYYLSLMDVFCLVSTYEGMPVALLEAMREGKAVIATDAYGMRDLLAGGEAGVLVPPDDIPATEEAIRSLALDPGRRGELGAAARARTVAELGWDAIARRYLALADAR